MSERRGPDDASLGAPPWRPVWLLDVDGVLNAEHPGWGTRPLTRTAYAAGTPFRMRFAPALVARLWQLHRSGRVEIRWATTWVEDIDEIVTQLRLPAEWTCAFRLTPTGPDANAAKYAAALRVVRHERRPLIWTDDVAVPVEGSHADRVLSQAGPPVLLLRPNSSQGLQPAHLEEIERFIQATA